mgnify:CR=1 FL=1
MINQNSFISSPLLTPQRNKIGVFLNYYAVGTLGIFLLMIILFLVFIFSSQKSLQERKYPHKRKKITKTKNDDIRFDRKNLFHEQRYIAQLDKKIAKLLKAAVSKSEIIARLSPKGFQPSDIRRRLAYLMHHYHLYTNKHVYLDAAHITKDNKARQKLSHHILRLSHKGFNKKMIYYHLEQRGYSSSMVDEMYNKIMKFRM